MIAPSHKRVLGGALLGPCLLLALVLPAPAEELFQPSEEALVEARRAASMIRLPKSRKKDQALSIDVFAAEPLLENGVAFSFDGKGRVFVAETFRVPEAVLDNRSRHQWPSETFKKRAGEARMKTISTELLDVELRAETIADRERMLRTYFAGDLERFTKDSEIIKRIVDRDGDGHADEATNFAAKFDGILDGALAGVLPYRGDVYATNMPSVWRLRDDNDDGIADKREELSRGYGVRFAFFGHDMHGLVIGPDGRLYFSFGDRGATVKTKEGTVIKVPETGAVFRCERDGSQLELVHKGLRNPQELAFDDFGNLFTGDNNSDGGDKARLVHLVEGGDSGWRIGYQYLDAPRPRGPWLGERMDEPHNRLQTAAILPPVANLGNGPSGLAYHPGTGAPSAWKGHFFMADFRGQASVSGIWAFRLRPRGASFSLQSPEKFAWGVLAPDVGFGPDGALYVLDWVTGWRPTGKGRLYRITDRAGLAENEALALARLFAEDPAALAADRARARTLLEHADQRIRRDVQIALAERGDGAVLIDATRSAHRLARLAGIWGLGQLVRQSRRPLGEPFAAIDGNADATATLQALLGDRDDEVRAQAARTLGDARIKAAAPALVNALSDRNPRVRFMASLALARTGSTAPAAALSAIKTMLAKERDRDPYLRHAGVMALLGTQDAAAIHGLRTHAQAAVRIAGLLALRRLGDARVADFLTDRDPLIVREAARAINDQPIAAATPALAALATEARVVKDEPTAVRVIAAAHRLGEQKGAEALGAIAANQKLAPAVRRDAIAALADWSTPRPRNLVTGNPQPFVPAERDAAPARAALDRVLPAVLASAPPAVSVAGAKAVAALGAQAMAAPLAVLAAQARASVEARREALRALDALDAAELGQVLPAAARDPDAGLRLLALRMRVARAPNEAVTLASAALADPAISVRQTAVELLGQRKTAEAARVLEGLLDELIAGKLPAALALDALEAAKKNGQPALAAKLTIFDEKRPQDDLGPYLEVMNGGDAGRGKQVFYYHHQVECRRCHSIEGHGATVGPELSGIGRKHDRRYLLEAIVYPSKHFAPGFESVLITMRDGAVHGGTLKKENATTLALDSVEEGQIELQKKLVADRERGVSAMPEGFGYILSKRELRDLIEFLATNP